MTSLESRSALGAAGPSRVNRVLVAVEVVLGVAVVALLVGRQAGAASSTFFLLTAAAFTFTAACLFGMGRALVAPGAAPAVTFRDHEQEALEHRKRLALQGIRELEADYGTGKVDPRDYEALRHSAEAEALGLMERLDALAETYRERAEAAAGGLGRTAEPSAAVSSPAVSSPADSSQADSSAAASPPRRAEAGTATWADAASPRPVAAPAPSPTRASAWAGLFSDEAVAFFVEEGQLFCGSCRTPNDDNARYCVGCGRPRETA